MSPTGARLIGMTIALPRLDLEAACGELARLGFDGVEVFLGQLGPGIVEVPLREAHAAAARGVLERAGLEPVLLNAIDGSFDPFGDFEASADALAAHLRLAAAMGMPRVLTWDGLPRAGGGPGRLARCLEAARGRSGLADPPAVSVELHPFTLALAHDLLEETAEALAGAGAGVCLDFCHFGVALAAGFAERLEGPVLETIDHVHWCDSDCATSELHFPPGEGVLDLERLGELLAGRDVALAWDLFGWPAPRAALGAGMASYEAAVSRHRASLAGSGA